MLLSLDIVEFWILSMCNKVLLHFSCGRQMAFSVWEIIIIIDYYCYHHFHGASGSVWRVLGLGLGMAGRARGWLRVGQAFEVLLLPGLGSAAPAPRFLGTQPPCATQALTYIAAWKKKEHILHVTGGHTDHGSIFVVNEFYACTNSVKFTLKSFVNCNLQFQDFYERNSTV